MEFFLIVFVVVAFLLIHYLKASKAERKPRPKSEPQFGSDNKDSSNLDPRLEYEQDAYHYELNPRLFTRAETSFFHALEAAVDGKLRIFGKVRIADVLNVKKGLNKRVWGYQFGRIKAKHFDYVLCTPNTLKIVCVIELDDSSHQKPDRVKRDDFVNAACRKTGLKLLRFKIQKHYNPTEISSRIFPKKPIIEPVNPTAVITDLKQSLDRTSSPIEKIKILEENS